MRSDANAEYMISSSPTGFIRSSRWGLDALGLGLCLYILHNMGILHCEYCQCTDHFRSFHSHLTLSRLSLTTQPFLASDSSIHSLFPPRVWAVRGPALILVGGLGVIGAFVGKVMMDEEKKKREKAQRVKQG